MDDEGDSGRFVGAGDDFDDISVSIDSSICRGCFISDEEEEDDTQQARHVNGPDDYDNDNEFDVRGA